MKYILALDQGTTSSRAIVFNSESRILSVANKEFTQIFPKPGWVEHDPSEIIKTQLDTAHAALEKAGINANQVHAIGITNQRETSVLWEKETGKPVYNAIVWQCRRTTDICKRLKEAGLEREVKERTGLVLDPYFSGSKVVWLFENIPGLRQRAAAGDILFGTVDSWLVYNLTGRHVTDPSNASRTLLYNIFKGEWDKEILKHLNIPERILPQVLPSSGSFGSTKKEIFGVSIPINGVAGDQQAALFGQTCFLAGNAKNTYGTGCFALMHTGKGAVHSKNNLLTTIAWDNGNGLEYALEGSVFVAGAVVQWLRDQLKIIDAASETSAVAFSVKDTGGVYFVPAFVGLGAPYWDPDVRGTIFGLTRGCGRAHIVRAALESIAFQAADLFRAMEKDAGKPVSILKVDGGASMNEFLMQFQADILGIEIQRPIVAETTALGAAYLAGLATGVWENTGQIQSSWVLDKSFHPRIGPVEREALVAGWKAAVQAARGY
ncbi:MAG: glycerol kinase GlpK [Spirochaetota bacterium]